MSPRLRLVLLALAAASLVAGLLGGLARLGALAPLGTTPALHGPLMVSGFLGTVIGLERAVALGSRLAYAAPFASGAGALLLLAGFAMPGIALLVAAPWVLLAASVAIVRRQAQLPTLLLAAAAFAWAVATLALAVGAAHDGQVAWGFTFLVLTIAAERLEMTRLMKRNPIATPLFLTAAAMLVVGAAGVLAGHAWGRAAFGIGLVGLAAWMMAFDIARRTVRTQGLARYAAVALLAGYLWLALAGAAWMALDMRPALRDAALHALGLGFVFSMIFAHGPIIVPAIARVRVRYTPWLYVPLALLHASLALRLIAGDPGLRAAAGLLNAASIALFAALLLSAMRRTEHDQIA